MTEVIFKEFLGNVKLLPFTGIAFYKREEWGDNADANVVFHQLEGESSWSIKGIMKDTFWGGKKKIGYNVDVNVYLPFNSDYESIKLTMDVVLKGRFSYSLLLGSAKASNIDYVPPAVINSTGACWIDISPADVNHSIEIEQVELRPRTIIRIQHFIKSLSDVTITNT
ncbi:MAG: hypothetical protein KIT33_12575 [Candidatus Kapabacteria bacterium]|nr:hypothetical protein [Ignavibacteriota bacterium]MCW5885795.1 hypothetical protein [Candidatus Kapabacteria bacterium]